MIANILLLLLGLILLVGGANLLTDGAASVAKRFRLSNLVIGLTVVAFSVSAPELVVSLTASLKESADIAVGNVLGSNIINILAVVGVAALIAPLSITNNTLRIGIPLVILSSLALFFMANDRLFDHSMENILSRTEGFVLLVFFVLFLFYVFGLSRGDDAPTPIRQFALGLSALMIVGGSIALFFGGQLFVDHAATLAARLGVSESVIALSVMAIGTSLPELITTIVALVRKQSGMAIGNIVGSNILNILLVLGVSASISPMRIQSITLIDYGIFIFAALLLYMFGLFFGDKTFQRFEGGILVTLYVCYISFLLFTA